jgi:hypothetical protein
MGHFGARWPAAKGTLSRSSIYSANGSTVFILAETILTDETNRTKVLWDTPRRLFGFSS